MASMDIVGGVPLKGTVYASGAKNALLPILAASVMLDGETNLKNAPYLGDVNIKLKSKLYPTSSETTHPSSGSYSSTNPTPIRVSGKQLKVRFEANTSQPSDFRIGTFKMEGRAGGGR
mgnify:CR=1 FL=1